MQHFSIVIAGVRWLESPIVFPIARVSPLFFFTLLGRHEEIGVPSLATLLPGHEHRGEEDGIQQHAAAPSEKDQAGMLHSDRQLLGKPAKHRELRHEIRTQKRAARKEHLQSIVEQGFIRLIREVRQNIPRVVLGKNALRLEDHQREALLNCVGLVEVVKALHQRFWEEVVDGPGVGPPGPAAALLQRRFRAEHVLPGMIDFEITT